MGVATYPGGEQNMKSLLNSLLVNLSFAAFVAVEAAVVYLLWQLLAVN